MNSYLLTPSNTSRELKWESFLVPYFPPAPFQNYNLARFRHFVSMKGTLNIKVNMSTIQLFKIYQETIKKFFGNEYRKVAVEVIEKKHKENEKHIVYNNFYRFYVAVLHPDPNAHTYRSKYIRCVHSS